MAIKVELDIQEQNKGGLPKVEQKLSGKHAMLTLSSILALLTASCSVTEAQNTTSKPVDKPAETAPIPGANEPQLAMQAFEINKDYPEALKPYVDVFSNMAVKDKLDLNIVNKFDFILARDPAKGTTVEYALMPMAVVNGLTDPDNEPANQKPVYYLAYKDEQGQVIGNYVLGRLLEQDSEGNVSYVSRILADASFQDWLNNTQPVDSQIDLGQIVYATALANGIDIKEARKIEQQLTGGELSSADFMKQYALGVSFIQPGQVARQVTIVNPLMPDNTPVEPSIVPSFWSRLFGVQPALAAGLELEATATAPGSTPIIEPTSSAEPTPTIEPTLSAEQQQQVIMNQFVNEPFYDQYIVDNQIPEQAATAFYEEYKGVDGEPFAVVTMKVDPNSLSEEQKALNIPQRDYLVVKTADGQIDFKLLPVNLQLETFSKSAVEFTLSKEYQKGLQDYLDAMGLQEENVTITEEVKVVNGQEYRFLKFIPINGKLNTQQQKYLETYQVSLFVFDPDSRTWKVDTTKDAANRQGVFLGVLVGGYGSRSDYSEVTALQKKLFNSAEVWLGWPDTEPEQNKFDWGPSDGDSKLARSYNHAFGLHLIWSHSLPDWIKKGNFSNEELTELISKRITETIKRYPDIDIWSVVNEYRHPKGDFFYNKLGIEYLDSAFQAARDANPNVTLVLNTYDDFLYNPGGLKTTQEAVDRLRQKQLIDKVGVQLYIDGSNPPSKDEVVVHLKSFGIPVIISEFSINMKNVGGDPKLRQLLQAQIAREMLEAALESGACNEFNIFGIVDRLHVYENPNLPYYNPNSDPSPIDDNYGYKPFYYSILATLQELQ